MYEITNNVENKMLLLTNSDEAFQKFTEKIIKENGDNFNPENIGDCIDYILTYCDNLDLRIEGSFNQS